jgi:hypothetical protein
MAKHWECMASPYAGQMLEIRYEDLVSNLEVTIRQVCAFLDEEFEPAMLDWHSLIELVPVRERHIHGKLSQQVSNDDIAVWRHRLSALECFAIEACLYQDLERLGYRLRFHGVMWRPLLSATGSALRTMGPVLRRCIPYLQRRNLLPSQLYF